MVIIATMIPRAIDPWNTNLNPKEVFLRCDKEKGGPLEEPPDRSDMKSVS